MHNIIKRLRRIWEAAIYTKIYFLLIVTRIVPIIKFL